MHNILSILKLHRFIFKNFHLFHKTNLVTMIHGWTKVKKPRGRVSDVLQKKSGYGVHTLMHTGEWGISVRGYKTDPPRKTNDST